MTIAIKTRLHDGIYKSSGGGETRIHYEWTTGPRNLLKAVDTFSDHARDMVAAYGNIGCGGSWLEIDGTRIHPFDVSDVRENDEKDSLAYKSRTEKARELIATVRSGTYDASVYGD